MCYIRTDQDFGASFETPERVLGPMVSAQIVELIKQ